MFKKRTLAWGFGSGLLLGWFSGCGLGLAWSHGHGGERYQPAKEHSRIQSPDGKLEAVISYRDAGMLSGDWAHLAIVRKGTSVSEAAKEPALLVLYGDALKATWRDNHHLLVDPGEGEINFLESLWAPNDKEVPFSSAEDPVDAEVQLVYGADTLYDAHGRMHGLHWQELRPEKSNGVR